MKHPWYDHQESHANQHEHNKKAMQCNDFHDGRKISNVISLIIKEMFIRADYLKENRSKPWIGQKLFLLNILAVSNVIGPTEDQVNSSQIYLLKLQQAYVQHLQKFESTHLILYQTYKCSISFTKSVSYNIRKNRIDK